MDVRCEKCQTEYELDEARLKPGGVTVKCTNCGHMFKIRKRTITNVGLLPGGRDAAAMRARTGSSKPVTLGAPASASAAPARAPARPSDSLFDDERSLGADEAPTTVERQWLIRLENGEQKSCRELATLQQWIVSGVVTRESLISRTGKTWKLLGDIADLGQYFAIADEARANRDRVRPPSRPAPIASIKEIPGTLPGYSAAQAAGGTILPDDDDVPEPRTTRAYQSRPVVNTPPPVPTRGVARSPAPPPSPPSLMTAPTELAAPPQPGRQLRTTPPPPPPKRVGPGPNAQPPAIPPPLGNRATAAWATDGVKPVVPDLPASAQSGPFVGKLAAIPDEPAFAGRVRIAPGDAASFDGSRVRAIDDDDELLPARRGSRAGMWVLIMALLVMGASAAAVYLFVLRTGRDEPAARPAKDAGAAAVAITPAPDAAAVATPPPAPADAAAVEAPPAVSGPRGELAADLEPRLRTAAQALDGKLDASSQALRAHLISQLAQDLQDRAALIAGTEAEGLRKEARQLVLDAATAAQRALRAAADDPGANLAMAEVLRLQGKPARDVKRYLDMARARPDKDWARDLALADALVLARDSKLDDARAAFAAIDQGDSKLETSGDVRARLHLALALAAQGKAAEAKPMVETILAAQPEHAGARALAQKLETQVTRTDPLPPEVGVVGGESAGGAGGAHTAPLGKEPGPRASPVGSAPAAGGGGDSYDHLLARANAIADTSCAKAMELYTKALEQKPNGIEALAGEGYCHIDAKQFASAFSKFRAALAVSSRYEPALRGIAEAYQQQGRKEQAIEAYKAYLEVYPGSVAAKKQLERLGGDAAPQAPPAAPPAPAPAPAPDPASAGSGSS
jgi:predicted Zn finger-like uncharacterized protein